MLRGLKQKSVDELLDLEQDLIDKVAIDEPWAVNNLIQLYKILIQKIPRDNENEHLRKAVIKSLVKHLIKYGTYLKTVVRKDDIAAEHCLYEALRFNNRIPIAHYRLGFLNYKKRQFSRALRHFEKAIELNKTNSDSEYSLNDLQQYYAHMYLTNSALYVADFAKKSLQSLDDSNYKNLPNYEISPFFNIISSTEDYLSKNAFTVISKDGKQYYCSKEEAEDLQDMKSKLICFFGDREDAVHYNRRGVELTINQAEILRYILLYGTKERPATMSDMRGIFRSRDSEREPQNNTFIRAVNRLKRKLDEILFPTDTIQSKPRNGQTGYFYTGEIGYLIIHRSDADFYLN